MTHKPDNDMNEEITPEQGEQLEQEARRLMEVELAGELLETGPSILGEELRPITLASIALLMQVDSDLIKGVPIEECRNVLLDCCRFIRLQTLPLKEAARLVRDMDRLDMEALEFADRIPANQTQEVIKAVVTCLRATTENRVEPVDEKAKSSLPSPDEMASGKS